MLIGLVAAVCAGLATAQSANLIQHPEEFEKWTMIQGATVTLNATAAPNGSVTADQINDDAARTQPRVASNGVPSDGGQYVFSCHLKAGALANTTLIVRAGGTIIAKKEGAALSASWQRLWVATPASTLAGRLLTAEIYPGGKGGDAGHIFAWGAQMEKGSTPTPYSGSGGSADTTPPAAPAGVAAQPSTSSVQVTWNGNTEPDLAGYRVWRSTSSTGPFDQMGSPASPAFTDSQVTAGTTYHYRVTAMDQAGNSSAPSATVQATVPAPDPDPTPPSAPTGLTGSWTGAAVQLNWSANPEANVTGYRVERATGSGSGTPSTGNLIQSPEALDTWSRIQGISVAPNTTAAPDGAQTADRLDDTADGSQPRVQSNGVTSGGGPYVFSCYVKAGSLTGATLVIRSNSSIIAVQEAAVSASWQRLSVVAGSTSSGSELRAEVYPGRRPGEAGNVYAWGAQLETGSSPTPYGSAGGGGTDPTFTQIGSPTQSSFADANVSPGTTYHYRVRAVNSAALVSEPSGTVTVSVPSGTTAPSAPTGLTGNWTGTAVQLNWNANPETSVTGYQLERGVNSTTSFSQLASPTQTTYTDAGVSAGNTYSYRVRAVNGAGTSAPSAVVSVTVPSGSSSIVRGPYLQMGSDTAMTVRWRTSSATNSRVRYGTAQGSLTSFADSATVTTEHEVRLTGLSADTRYYYSVGSTTQVQGGNDASHYFITNPTPGTRKPTRIWVIGDAGTADSNQRAVRDAYFQFAGTRHTDLWLMLGDNAYDNGTDSEFQAAVFDVYGALLRQSVVWPTRGNHEDTDSTGSVYYNIFTMPKGGEAGGLASGTEKYYSYDYGNIHFICLDSEGSDRSANGAMAQWLQADLGNTTREWIIAYWHHPPYSKGSHDSDDETELVEMRENILPILEAGGVDLVLSGHSHSYERSYLLDGHYDTSNTLTSAMKVNGGDGRPDGNGAYGKATLGPAPHQGAVYVVAGSSGKVSSGTLDHPAMFISLKNLGSVVLDVDGNRLDAKYLRETGAVQDYFTIIKGP